MIRHFTLRLFLPILCAFIFAQVTKADEVIIGQLKYRLYDNWTAEVSSKDESISGDIVIPGEITYNDSKYAVTGIGTFGFIMCKKITSITLPNSIKDIEVVYFSRCDMLKNFIVSDDHPNYRSVNGVLFSKDQTILVLFPNGKPSNYIIPNGVTTIGRRAFNYNSKLTSVIIPNSVTTIEEEAFEGCGGLTSITLPNSLITIGLSAFDACNGLTSITIPDNVISIGNDGIENPTRYGSSTWPFCGCKKLREYKVTHGNRQYSSIDGVLFNKEKTRLVAYPNAKSPTYAIPESVTTIGENAFADCEDLISITLHNGLTTINGYAFAGCQNLKSIDLGDNISIIAGGAFWNCTGLTSIHIPNSITTINESTFSRCKGLTSVNIPNSVKSILNDAFSDCTNLASIKISDSLTYMGSGVFKNTAWYDSQEDGVIYAGLTLYQYKGTMPDNTSIEIKNNTVYICDQAFLNCTGLYSVTIPNTVTKIGYGAFKLCAGIKEIYSANPTPPESTTNIFEDTDQENCTLYIPEGALNAYRSSWAWRGFGNIQSRYFVSVHQTTGGNVLVNDQPIGTVGFSGGESVTFTITPYASNSINTVMLNDNDITSQLINNQYTINPIDKSINLNVKFNDNGSSIALTPETVRPNIYAAHGKVVIENAPEGEKISIVNLTGQLVYQGMETEIPLGRGLYLVRVGKTVKKVMAE